MSAVTKVNRDLFFKLASDLQEERVQAAISLINELSALAVPECNEEWSYVLNRLITGLSSNRNSARLGFSMCLTEVINLAIDMQDSAPSCLRSIDDFLDILSNTLSIESITQGKKLKKGKDERGVMFGKMFALQALLNEPLCDKIFYEDKKHSRISKFAIKFQAELVDLALLKNWLREPSLFTLFQTVQRFIPNADVEYVESLISLLDERNLTLTNEGLAIYLALLSNSKTKDMLSSITLNSQGWKSNDPLSKGNLPLLSQVLLDSKTFNDDDSQTNKSSTWNPRLNFVWDTLLSSVLDNSVLTRSKSDFHVSKKQKKENAITSIEFPAFWQMAVDESYFNEKASSERKYLGFLIFQRTIDLVPAQWVHCIFGQNFMRSLINQSSDSKRMLNKISQKVLSSIIEACEKDSAKLVPVLEHLLFTANGSINFDKLTKTKTVSKLLAIKDLDSAILSQLFEMLNSEISEVKQNNHKTQFVLDTLLHVVRNQRTNINAESVANSLLESLIDLAFFTKENEYMNEVAKERLFSILSELVSSKDSTHSWQYIALDIIFEKENKGGSLVTQLDETLVSVKDEAFKCLKEVSLKTGDSEAWALESLLAMSLIQLYSGDVESVSILEDLCTFCTGRNDDNISLVGITEILLSLLAQRKALLKKLSLLVWEQFVEKVGEEEVKILLDVLHARENKQGFAHLFEGADEYEDDEDDNEDKSTEQENQKADNSESSSSESEESSDEDESGSDQDDNVAKIDKEAASALAKALNLPDNIINENGEVDIDMLEGMSGDGDGSEEEEEDDESMDDEKMMELDDQLSEIFKRRKEALSEVPTGNKRKFDVKESRESVIAFKHRIVDMLEIYLKQIEKMSANKAARAEMDSSALLNNVLQIIGSMIKCIQETLDKSLAEKISKLLRSRLFKVQAAIFSGIDDSTILLEQLSKIQVQLLVAKPGQFSTVYYSVCSASSLFLCKLLVENTPVSNRTAVYDQLIEVYAETTKKWMSEGKFGPNIFVDFYNWLSSKKQATHFEQQ